VIVATFGLFKVAGGDWSFVGLPGADLRNASISGVRMREADLTGARCQGATLQHVDLSGAWLPAPTWAAPTCAVRTFPRWTR
jgi:fluoroquinolone resistance protein